MKYIFLIITETIANLKHIMTTEALQFCFTILSLGIKFAKKVPDKKLT